MRLISLVDAGQPGPCEQVCRTSPTRDYVTASIFFGLIVICLFYYLKLLFFESEPVPMVAHLILLWFIFWSGLFLMLAWSRAHACRLSSNWLLRLSSSTVLIKFRSFQNHYYPDTDRVVIELSWSDISWVRKTKETSHRGRGEDTMTESFTYLDLKLDLQKDQLAHLQSALQEEKQRKPPRSTIGSLKHELYQARRNNKPKHEIETIKSRIRQARLHRAHARKGGVKYNDVPVRLVNTSILRVRWNAVQPDINKTLSLFAKQTQVDDDISFVTDSSRELQGKELEDMIVERLDRGDIMEATGMVKTHYGLSTMEAKRYLDELSSKNNN